MCYYLNVQFRGQRVNSLHAITVYFFMIHFSIILPCTPVYSSEFFTAGLRTKYPSVFLSPMKYVHIVISADLFSVAAFSSLFQRAPLTTLLELLTVVFTWVIQGDQKVCVPDDYSTKKNWWWRWQSQNTFGMWTVLHWTRSSRTQFGVSINDWRLAEDTLNITCNFLYCNHQVHRDFLITLYYGQADKRTWKRVFTFRLKGYFYSQNDAFQSPDAVR